MAFDRVFSWFYSSSATARTLTVGIALVIMILATIGIGSGHIKTSYADITWSKFPVNIGGQDYQLNYTLSANATLNSVIVDEPGKTLVFMIDAHKDGQLVVELPRKIIDSSEDKIDRPYYASITTAGSDEGEEAKPATELYGSSNDVRILMLNFSKDTTMIRIIGTYLSPEFGDLMTGIMLTAFAILIVATSIRMSQRTLFK